MLEAGVVEDFASILVLAKKCGSLPKTFDTQTAQAFVLILMKTLTSKAGEFVERSESRVWNLDS